MVGTHFSLVKIKVHRKSTAENVVIHIISKKFEIVAFQFTLFLSLTPYCELEASENIKECFE